jgi:endonuclease V-like protein UPF0215 family
MVRLKRCGEPYAFGKVFAQFFGASEEDVRDILSMWKGIPEPIRLAHIIAGGVVKGESRGKA